MFGQHTVLLYHLIQAKLIPKHVDYFPHFATVLCHRTHYTGTTTSPLDTLSARVNYRHASLPNFALPPDFTDYKLFLSVKEGKLRRLWHVSYVDKIWEHIDFTKSFPRPEYFDSTTLLFTTIKSG